MLADLTIREKLFWMVLLYWVAPRLQYPLREELLVIMIEAWQKCLHFSTCACHPCAGAMLIFFVSFQFQRMIPEGNPLNEAYKVNGKWPCSVDNCSSVEYKCKDPDCSFGRCNENCPAFPMVRVAAKQEQRAICHHISSNAKQCRWQANATQV